MSGDDEPVVVFESPGTLAIYFAESRLQAAGIPYLVLNQTLRGLGTGPMQIEVPAIDADTARELLADLVEAEGGAGQ